jgi:hypothetical protein
MQYLIRFTCRPLQPSEICKVIHLKRKSEGSRENINIRKKIKIQGFIVNRTRVIKTLNEETYLSGYDSVSFEMSGTTRPTTQRIIPHDVHPQKQGYKNVTRRKSLKC